MIAKTPERLALEQKALAAFDALPERAQRAFIAALRFRDQFGDVIPLVVPEGKRKVSQ